MIAHFTFEVCGIAHIETEVVLSEEDSGIRLINATLLERPDWSSINIKGKRYTVRDLARWEALARFKGLTRCAITGVASVYCILLKDGRYVLADLALCDHNGDYQAIEDCHMIDGKWYHNSELERCPTCGKYFVKGMFCEHCFKQTVDGEILPTDDCVSVRTKTDGFWDLVWTRKEKAESYPYCSECGCHVMPEYWRDDFGICASCEEKTIYWDGEDEDERDDRQEIWAYHESPEGRRRTMRMFGNGKSRFGWELEIGGAPRSSDPYCLFNNLVAHSMKRTSGIEDGEVWFERDGSIAHTGGFEIISAPHTVKDFWDKRDKWAKMLDYLSSKGFKSHETGCCGLHVHVGRTMLGDTEVRQQMSIAKIFKFYEVHWEDLERASRRRSFSYCNKSKVASYSVSASVQAWKNVTKHNCSGVTEDGDSSPHHLALNNSNANTFEFRLGRGTLNKQSFFAWIDLCLAIARNARKITIAKSSGKDATEWLKGIRSSTARYLFKRGAFSEAVMKLFPEIRWECDTSDENAA